MYKRQVLALGGELGSAPDLYQALAPLARDLRGGVLADCGHYLPEEQPRELAPVSYTHLANEKKSQLQSSSHKRDGNVQLFWKK